MQDASHDSLADSADDNSLAFDEAAVDVPSGSEASSGGRPLPQMRSDRVHANGGHAASPGEYEELSPQGRPSAENGKEIGNLQGLLARAMHQKQQVRVR